MGKGESQSSNSILQNANNSAEIVASIDDILTLILIKVPIKPLTCFKLVNKHWFSLINSHGFCLMRNPIPNPSKGLFFGIKSLLSFSYKYQYIPFYPNSFVSCSINMDFTIAPFKTLVLHSCNSLLLCCSSKLCDDIDTILFEPDCAFYVFNPTTKISTALPHMPDLLVYPNFRSHKAATLVFDPVKSPHYKVLLVVTNGRSCCKIKVYSSYTDCWSDGGEIEINQRVNLFGSGVYWNGSVHWLNREFSASNNDKISLRFHVDTQMLHEMPSPPVVRDQSYRKNYYFGESCGHLHFVEPVLPEFSIYEMKVDYSGWFVRYRVDLSSSVADYPEVIMRGFDGQNYDLIYVLSLVRGENDKDSNLVMRIQRKAIKFNLVNGTSEKLCDFVHDEIDCQAIYSSGMYGESYRFKNEHSLDYIQSLCSC